MLERVRRLIMGAGALCMLVLSVALGKGALLKSSRALTLTASATSLETFLTHAVVHIMTCKSP